MITQKNNSPNCSILINSSCLVLRLSHSEIVNGYSDNTLFLKDHIEKGVHEKIIDIVFDDEGATLSCIFDENDICTASYIFLDNANETNSYIDYMNKKYNYNYIRCCWLLHDSRLSIVKLQDDIIFRSFY